MGITLYDLLQSITKSLTDSHALLSRHIDTENRLQDEVKLSAEKCRIAMEKYDSYKKQLVDAEDILKNVQQILEEQTANSSSEVLFYCQQEMY